MADTSPPRKVAKGHLISKFVQLYETVFKGQLPAKEEPFWEELLLLRVNVQYLEQFLGAKSERELVAMKSILQKIVRGLLSYARDENRLRSLHAIQTLAVIFASLFQKKYSNFSYDLCDLVCGFEEADTFFRMLLTTMQDVAKSRATLPTRAAAGQLLLVLASAFDNINQNTLLEYFRLVDVFPTISQLIQDEAYSARYAHDALALLAILANYQKFEESNPYLDRIAAVETDDKFHQALLKVAHSYFIRYNKMYLLKEPPAKRLLTRWTAVLSSWIWTPPPEPERKMSHAPHSTGAILLALYQQAAGNRALIPALVGAAADAATRGRPERPDAAPAGAAADTSAAESDVLSSFLVFCSNMFQDVRDVRSSYYARLSLIILRLLCEDRAALALLHDAGVEVDLPLHRGPHAGASVRTTARAPFAVWVMECLLMFMHANLSTHVQVDGHRRCIDVLLRLLCHQKRAHSRLPVDWRQLWRALFAVMGRVATDEMMQKPPVITLGIQMAHILNFFITYGDKLLPDSTTYDEFFYEIIQAREVISTFSGLARKYDAGDHLSKALLNVREVVRHFMASLEGKGTITHEQTLATIRANYGSLTLTLEDNLDHYERWSEYPNEAAFMQQAVRSLVYDQKNSLVLAADPDERASIDKAGKLTGVPKF